VGHEAFIDALSRSVWEAKYRFRPAAGQAERADESIGDSWERVAGAVASVESDAARWRREFRALLEDFRFLPAGRILAGAGTGRRVTLFNCFVMDHIPDSLEGIFEHLKRSALTMQWGGGIGIDFSTLRPRGSEAHTRGTIASGPVSFMRVWDAMCATLLSTGARRGAMMGTLRADHPDIETFIDAKRERGALTNFNVSVQVSDALMDAVAADGPWPLCFPADEDTGLPTRQLRWPGYDGEVRCAIHRELPARALWWRIMEAAYDSAEPGVLFVDRINQQNNLWYRETITSTNPCGEIPLPPHGACDLGSLNLAAFVREPFAQSSRLDHDAIERCARVAVRFLDDVIDLSRFALPEQQQQARATRRIGLGITGVGDALAMLGLHYDSDAGRAAVREALGLIRDSAYLESAALAEEKGAFPAFDRERFLAGEYVSALPARVRDAIAGSGLRNSHLIAIAPTGTISVLANNVSSGVEPIFALQGERRVLDQDGQPVAHPSTDFAWQLWQHSSGGPPPSSFVTAAELAPDAHIAMLAALQPLVDNAISKTINVPENISREHFASIYERAYQLGLKGCTVFRPNPVTGAVLTAAEPPARVHCCTPDREGD
jgi:ribonucleoside-diphosphate reductase alpha chain